MSIPSCPPPPSPQRPSTLPTFTAKLRKRKKSVTSTQESPVENSVPTSNDRSPLSEQDTLATSSSRTSVPASTSSDPALLPYWNDRVRDWSARLFSPTGTGFAGLRTTSSNRSSTSTRQTWSWFSRTHHPPPTDFRNSLRIYLPSTQSTSVECKEDEPQKTEEQEQKGKRKRPKPMGTNRRKKRKKDKELSRTLKIRLYPNALQKARLRQWMGCARLVYNMVVDNYHQRYRPTKQFFFRYLLKRRIEREWHFMKTVPYEVLDHAISGAITARDEVITRNRERFANGNQAPIHRLAFLTKKSARNTITIRSQYCRTPLKFYVRLLHNREMLACQPDRKKGDTHPPFHHENRRKNHHWPNLEGSVDCDSKLTYDKRLRQWTLAWVYQKDAGEGENQANPRVVSLDPGVVSFQTWYSPTGGTGSIGTRDIERIVRLCLQMDNLIGRTTKVDARKRNGYRRAQARIRQRIRNLVDEMHKQVANWLANNFDIIVLPQFGSQRMSLRRPGRRLNSKTVRNMLTWSHARFRTRLGGKCEETGAQLVTPDSEAYTSKTCTGCGNLHLRLGGARVFRCRQCGLIMDRDANAAKGILLRALACGALSA